MLTVAYVGSQGRNLFLRGITNRITGVIQNPTTGVGTVVREFSVVNGTTVTNRFAEIDTKTSGGTDNYNGLQILLNRRFSRGLTMGAQYVWNHSIGDSDGSKDARSSSNNYIFTSEHGDNISDVRQSFNLSMLYQLPNVRSNALAKSVLGGWQVGTVFNARTGLPIDVEIARAAIVYRNNTTGVITTSPVVSGGVVQTTALVNIPGGGQSRNVARPDLVPGVDPYIHNKGWLYINPAAFVMPAPGSYGNLGRNALRGPGSNQVDFTLSKKFPIREVSNVEFRAECYNVLNSPVYQVPGLCHSERVASPARGCLGSDSAGPAIHRCRRWRQLRRAHQYGLQHSWFRNEPAVPVGAAIEFLTEGGLEPGWGVSPAVAEVIAGAS